MIILTVPAQVESIAIVRVHIKDCLRLITGYPAKDVHIAKVYPQAGDIVEIDPKIEGEAIIAGQVRNRHASSGAGGQRHGLAEGPAVHIAVGAILRVEGTVVAGAVGVIAVKMLEAQGIRIVRHKLIIRNIVVDIQSADFDRGQGGAVAAILQLVVVDVGHVSDFFIIVNSVVVGIVDGDEGRRVLDIYQVVFVRAVVNGNIVAAVILIIVKIVGSVIVVVGGIIIIPGLKICTVGVVIVIGGVPVQEVRELDVGLVVVCVIGSVMDGVEGLIVAVNDVGGSRIAAPVVVGHITIFVLHAAGRGGIVSLGLIGRK